MTAEGGTAVPSTTITDVRLWDGPDPAATWDVAFDGDGIVAVGPSGGAVSALRRTDRGAIAVGARADLLLVDDDPLRHLATARRPSAVWVGGERVV